MHPVWNSLIKEQTPHASITEGNRISFAGHSPEALSHTNVALSPLSHLGLLRVEGEEAAAFLHNLTSNDVKSLAVGGVQWNSLNSAKGRMLASFLVLRDETGFSLVLAEDLAAEIARKLSMYVLRAKVKVSNASDNHVLLGLDGEHASQVLQKASFSIPQAPVCALVTNALTIIQQAESTRFMVILPAERLASVWSALLASGACASNTDHWIRGDILSGIPLITKPIQEEFIAQMVNYDLLGGVNFKKGCYPGQEIVARTQYLGKLKKRMYLAHDSGPTAPATAQDVYAPSFGDQSCGKVVVASRSPQGGHDLLVVLQMAAHEENDVHLGSPTGPKLSFGELPYKID